LKDEVAAALAGLQALVEQPGPLDPIAVGKQIRPLRIIFYRGLRRAKKLDPSHPLRRQLAEIERLFKGREDLRLIWETGKPTALLENECYHSDPMRNRWRSP
jgi:hypothetical protein